MNKSTQRKWIVYTKQISVVTKIQSVDSINMNCTCAKCKWNQFISQNAAEINRSLKGDWSILRSHTAHKQTNKMWWSWIITKYFMQFFCVKSVSIKLQHCIIFLQDAKIYEWSVISLLEQWPKSIQHILRMSNRFSTNQNWKVYHLY